MSSLVASPLTYANSMRSLDESSPTRAAVRSVWENRRPDFSGVTDAEAAERVFTGLLSATLDLLEYRRLCYSPGAIQLVSSDHLSYHRFEAADERTANISVQFSHALSAHAADANMITDATGTKPHWNSMRVVVLANSNGAIVKRLDLDPDGRTRMSWHGPFDHDEFSDIALGLSMLLTHLVAQVFDDDDGSETFEESFDWVL